MILRVFPRRTSYTPTDDFTFIGFPPLLRPANVDAIHISVTFRWDIGRALQLQKAWLEIYPYTNVLIGGPAIDGRSESMEFMPGKYVKPGVTFTTRGCNHKCPWCLVPFKEGRLRILENIVPGHIIQDNNLLQASRAHIERVLAMLKVQKRAAIFAGGLEAGLVRDWFAEELRGMRIDQVFLAADAPEKLRPLERALGKLHFLPLRKKRVYVMIGFEETISQAEERLEQVFELGALPFAQLYQPETRFIEYPAEWKALARKWMRPAAMLARSPLRVDSLDGIEEAPSLLPHSCGIGEVEAGEEIRL